ncbi:MAG: ABC transporter ATP-binding protein [Candidatus Velthaea sp.]
MSIVLDGVTKTFPESYGVVAWCKHRGRPPRRRALDDVSFRVERGELFGLLGANGAGKSTILRLMAGLLTPDRGRLEVEGVDAVAHPVAVRRRIGLSSSDDRSFYHRISARANLELFAGLTGVPRAERAARVVEVARVVNLADDLDRRFDAFSSGMRQRLAVARALLGRPDVLLFDEPTRAVDPVNADELRRFIRDRLVRERGTTVVLTTNVLEEAWQMCDRVGILSAGRLLTTGAPADLRRLGNRLDYTIVLDRVDDALIARTRAVQGVIDLAVSPVESSTALRVGIDSRDQCLTHLLRAVSANGVRVLAIRPEDPSPSDLFRHLTKAVTDGR